MAILRDVARTPQIATHYLTAGIGPAPRGRRMLGDELPTYANTLRAPGMYQPQAQSGPAMLPGANDMIMAHPASPNLRYANIDGRSVLMPRGANGATGSVGAGAALDAWRQGRAQEAAMNRPDESLMEQRRIAYQQRAQDRKKGLQDGRLARLAQQQIMSGQPVTPLAYDSLQRAQLKAQGNQGDFNRSQSYLDARQAANNMGVVGHAQIGLDKSRIDQLLPSQAAAAQQLGGIQSNLDIARAKQMAADQAMQSLDTAKQMAAQQRADDKAGALNAYQTQQELAQAQQQFAATQPGPGPDYSNPESVSQYIENKQFRMTPEQFQRQLYADPNANPSALRDVYDRLQNQNSGFSGAWNWLTSSRSQLDRQKQQRDFLRRVLGVQ